MFHCWFNLDSLPFASQSYGTTKNSATIKSCKNSLDALDIAHGVGKVVMLKVMENQKLEVVK